MIFLIWLKLTDNNVHSVDFPSSSSYQLSAHFETLSSTMLVHLLVDWIQYMHVFSSFIHSLIIIHCLHPPFSFFSKKVLLFSSLLVFKPFSSFFGFSHVEENAGILLQMPYSTLQCMKKNGSTGFLSAIYIYIYIYIMSYEEMVADKNPQKREEAKQSWCCLPACPALNI